MSLEPLATPDDLLDRNIEVPCDVDPSAALASASAAVRDAAGCPISQTTSTVVLIVDSYCEFAIPAPMVTAVSSVKVGGVEVDGWSKIGNTVIMPTARWVGRLPAEVTVTFTHGLVTVPSDIVDLVCGMTAIAVDQDYAAAGRLASVQLGSLREAYIYAPGADSPSPVALPDSVKRRLQARFGQSVATIGQR